ncbi:MAG: hypothetical protein LBI65_01655, partial [Candidatus Symbiothrix sp.]|nr:hypothetical protein [Candidatus Symbiothrix sp.]
TLDPFTWNNSAGNNNTTNNGKPDVMAGQYKDIKGWMFQFGRQADGHQFRNSTVVNGQPTIAQYNANPASHTNFYYHVNTAYYDWVTDPTSAAAQSRWGRDTSTDLNKPKHATDPCPPGWKIPTIWHYVYIMNGVLVSDNTVFSNSQATANTLSQGINGNKIGDELYMEAGGWRATTHPNQNVNQCGEHTHYWTTTLAPPSINGNNVTYCWSNIGYGGGWFYCATNPPTTGAAVRCVAE